jgi:hypothetical protein
MLELTTVRERQKIKIDDVDYEMREWSELPLADSLRVTPILQRMQSSSGKGKPLKEAELLEVADVVVQLAAFFLPDATSELLKKLTETQKMAIVATAQAGKDDGTKDFFARLKAKQKPAASSRASNGSTADRRKTGKR